MNCPTCGQKSRVLGSWSDRSDAYHAPKEAQVLHAAQAGRNFVVRRRACTGAETHLFHTVETVA